MGKRLYWDCSAGISGDMAVASLLDLGADEAKLRTALDSLGVDGFSIEISTVQKSGLSVRDFAVNLDEGCFNPDHDMDYLYGPVRDEATSAHHHHHHHHHDDGFSFKPHSNDERVSSPVSGDGGPAIETGHVHRNLSDVVAMIERADLTERARKIAQRIFEIIASAEASVHGVSIDEVHFHEVGAIDSIVDIVAVAVCIDDLAIDEVVVPCLYDGQGFIRCQHGLIPVPVPATTAIISAFALPLKILPIEGELVTPTGAAIVAALRNVDRLDVPFVIKAVGMGAGKRAYATPGILRAMIIESAASEENPSDPSGARDKSL